MEAKEFLEYRIDNDYGGTELGDTLMDNVAVITELLESFTKSLQSPPPINGREISHLRRKFFKDLTRKRRDKIVDFNCLPHNVFEWIKDNLIDQATTRESIALPTKLPTEEEIGSPKNIIIKAWHKVTEKWYTWEKLEAKVNEGIWMFVHRYKDKSHPKGEAKLMCEWGDESLIKLQWSLSRISKDQEGLREGQGESEEETLGDKLRNLGND